MTIQTILDSIKTETTRFYSLKTKSARAKSSAKITALKVQASELLDAQAISIDGKIITGKVILVDSYDGDLWIETEGYGRVYANICNSIDSKSWYPTTCCVEFSKDQSVEFILNATVDFNRSCIILGAKAIKGGKLNVEKYAELCQKGNLAFFKYPDGNMSGLFSSK